MNKKGFTLVELLAVILILGVIVLITVISVNSTLKETKQSLSQTQIKNIENAAKTYYINEQISNDNTCIAVSDLVDKGYLNGDIIDPKSKEQITGYVKVSYDSKKYTYKYQEYCYICKPVNVATTGNVPSGNYEPGDEYLCEVKKDTRYRFFVLNSDDENVNLIMYANINDEGVPVDSDNMENKGNVEWINNKDFIDVGGKQTDWNNNIRNKFGPITALNYLEKSTSDWEYLKKKTIDTYYSDSSKISTMNKTYNMYARLPNMLDFKSTGYEWLYNYTSFVHDDGNYIIYINGVNGYWLNNAVDFSDYNYAVAIHGQWNPYLVDDLTMGVRPVITVSKAEIN